MTFNLIFCQAALEVECHEVAYIWQLLGQVLSAAQEIGDDQAEGPWSSGPLGQSLVSSLLNHQVLCNDFQSVAMMICALTEQTKVVTPTNCRI